MTKKFVICLSIYFFICVNVSAGTGINTAYNEYDKDCKIQYYSEGGYWFINGFNFEHYNSKDLGLEKLVDNEIEKVYKNPNYAKNYYIVGHSQGGPSALAFATKLSKSKYDYSQLKGVVTVSGIDRGLKALEGGFGPFKARIMDDVNTLHSGFLGTIGAIPFVEFASLFGMTIQSYTDEAIVNKIMEYLPLEIKEYVNAAWYSKTEKDVQQLYDMIPESTFLQKNVSSKVQRTYKVYEKTGIEWYIEKKGILRYPAKRAVYGYKYYNTYLDTPKFPSNLPVAYIVGKNNNALSLLEGQNNSISESKVRNIVGLTEAGFITGALANAAEAVIKGAQGKIPNAILHSGYVVTCTKAACWCGNIDNEINELLNSNEHDGFVAKESQFFPQKWVNPGNNSDTVIIHNKMLGDQNIPYYEYIEYNHDNINPKKNSAINDKIREIIGNNKK